MPTGLSFDAVIGRFTDSEQTQAAEQLLDQLLEESELGEMDLADYIGRLRAIVSEHSEFVDGYAHLGLAFLNAEQPKLAIKHYQVGFDLGLDLLPESYEGSIEWGYLENRPFLRAAHGIVLCHLAMGRKKPALTLMERMLAWSPNDNQGIRFIIGSVYLRTGSSEAARAIFAQNADQYPPYRYELGLTLIREGRLEEAATELRRGFVENAYIVEMLCGMESPMPLAIWHGSNLARVETAREYVSRYHGLWEATPEALHFLRWLHTHPKILAERALIFGFREALLWEHEFHARGRLVKAEDAALEAIDNRLSSELVRPRTDRDGKVVMPWRQGLRNMPNAW